MTHNVLHIDSSARIEGSVSRDLSASIVAHLGGTVIRRDLTNALPQITADWVGANFTSADQRDALQRDTLALSDELDQEVEAADIIVIGAPIYNFSVPASLKAWIDLIARAGRTFRYTEKGPEGLLGGKRAIIAVASGGTEVGGDADFASKYLTFVLNFIGITDIEIIAADQVMVHGETAVEQAKAKIEHLAA